MMSVRLPALLLLAALSWLALPGALADDKTDDKTALGPSDTYLEYSKKLAKGMTFEECCKSFTKKKQKQVEEQVQQYTKSMKKSREEVIAMFMDLNKKMAGDAVLKLESETIKGKTAIVTYEAKSRSKPDGEPAKHVVTMVKESDGWKMEQVEIKMG